MAFSDPQICLHESASRQGSGGRVFCPNCDSFVNEESWEAENTVPRSDYVLQNLSERYKGHEVKELTSEIEIRRYVDAESVSIWVKQGKPMRGVMIDGEFHWETHYDFKERFGYQIPDDIYLLWLNSGRPDLRTWDIDSALENERKKEQRNREEEERRAFERQQVEEAEEKRQRRRQRIGRALDAFTSTPTVQGRDYNKEIMDGIKPRTCPFCGTFTMGTGPCSICAR